MNEKYVIGIAVTTLVLTWLAIVAVIFPTQFGKIKPNFRTFSHRKLEWLRELSTHFTLVGSSVAVYAGVKQENPWFFVFSVCWTVGFLGLGYMMTTWLEDHDRGVRVDSPSIKS